MKHAALDKGFGTLIVISHVNCEFQLLFRRGATDSHGGGGVGGRQVPTHNQQGDLIGITALQGAADGIELIAELLDCEPDPLLGLVADALGGAGIIEDVRYRRMGDIGCASHVFNRRPAR